MTLTADPENGNRTGGHTIVTDPLNQGLYTFLFVYISTYLFIYSSTYRLLIYLSTRLLLYLPIYLIFFSSIHYLSNYLSDIDNRLEVT